MSRQNLTANGQRGLRNKAEGQNTGLAWGVPEDESGVGQLKEATAQEEAGMVGSRGLAPPLDPRSQAVLCCVLRRAAAPVLHCQGTWEG